MPSPWLLILTPTAGERDALASRTGLDGATIELCGFGPIAAAARTAALLAQLRPARVLLTGLAGTYDNVLPLGAAFAFESIAIDRLGAGEGERYQPASDIGFSQWPEPPGPIEQRLALWQPPGLATAGLLLTTCTASAAASEAAGKRGLFPEAVAEDMEGFGVALACALAGVPLAIVRGISNLAGNRDKREWRIDAALAAAGDLVEQLVGSIDEEKPQS
ncbi:futalosine hydrolase [Lignipirellula cremea]|uniref:Futalosine hydrolase n=1 Tax=Lignipirellula cremea TaxID=2528010 RepID=A0A518DXZ4_9BACT|nr:futalosine hydrolase [Lignipirellula cremea]QDU96717.1 Futalosine hydrolase [Lignipirellula cremea]